MTTEVEDNASKSATINTFNNDLFKDKNYQSTANQTVLENGLLIPNQSCFTLPLKNHFNQIFEINIYFGTT